MAPKKWLQQRLLAKDKSILSICLLTIKIIKTMSKIRMKLTHVLPVQTGVNREGKPWKKQDFVFEDPDVMYPNVICATIFGEDKLSRFTARVGDLIDVEFAFNAHEYNGKWFNEVRVRDFSLATN
jgi:hypothetical protein